jgi:hypothetical protein
MNRPSAGDIKKELELLRIWRQLDPAVRARLLGLARTLLRLP